MQNNNLVGSIPTNIGKLQRLKKLYLQNNMLEGNIDQVFNLSELTRLIVENNRLSGTLPHDLCKLSSLEEGACFYSFSVIHSFLFYMCPNIIFTSVRMGFNEVHGRIPASLLGLTALSRLELHGNHLSGELIIQQSSSLEYLHLYDNNLSGQLTSSTLCHLSRSLRDLRLNNNSFTGNVPDLDCVMERLELLSLGQNLLTGTIHDSLGESALRLREIHLHENNLRSTIPHSLFLPENLTAVLLGNNELTGTCDVV